MKQNGFSFIELTIVVAIIGILASIAVPQYEKYVQRATRVEGMAMLVDVMRSQENFYANNFSFTTSLSNVNYSFATDDKYKITASTCGASIPLTECVRLTASGQGSQTSDGNLTLDSRGNRTHKGNTGWPK